MTIVPGQRYVSAAEPELGLGTVLKLEGRSLRMLYASCGVIRQYALQSAPLTRAAFDEGDELSAHGKRFKVIAVKQVDGLLVYSNDERDVSEAELDDVQSFATADARMLLGQIDSNRAFGLRLRAIEAKARARLSPTWGFSGARVSLIAHQLRVAEETARRRPPRVLLADEVGLGKTIEACLIISRLIATGRVSRVLILLPESLIHQWFVELLRRFNLQFAIYDAERCEAIQLTDPKRNPFADEQLILTDIQFLSANRSRAREALLAGFDLVIIDEAHHLEWTEAQASPEYQLAEAFSLACDGLLLLTATPEQLGRTGHFARLKLLDPARYCELNSYLAEQAQYAPMSELVGRLLDGRTLAAVDQQSLLDKLGAEVEPTISLAASGDERAIDAVVQMLIDRHGTGRVMFRNRRAQLGGFPQRIAMLAPITADLSDEQRADLKIEFQSDVTAHPHKLTFDFSADPRLKWLLKLLEQRNGEKVLLICRSKEKVLALEEALRTRSSAKVARFHEQLGIVQRDRNAAYFADPEGANLLLCSEIGSEGRNFQFAHHLVLFDLPLDPDLLEQRIGRLDRIGQSADISIHVPFIEGSAQEVLVRWYHEALNAFSEPVADGRELLKRHSAALIDLAARFAEDNSDAEDDFDALIRLSRQDHEAFAQALAAGRDRLLELSSLRLGEGDELKFRIARDDEDPTVESFALDLFEHFGVDNEWQRSRTFLLNPEYLTTAEFPGLKEGPEMVTFSREDALAREDLTFLRFDHPMLAGAIELLLGAEKGSTAFLIDQLLPPQTALLECVFVLECVGDRELNVDRFLPPRAIVVLIDTKLRERLDYQIDPGSLNAADDARHDYARYLKFFKALVPPMLNEGKKRAEAQSKTIIEAALETMRGDLGHEIERLVALQRVNPNVSDDEIESAREELSVLNHDLGQSRLRLDALRFIASRDFLSLR